MWLHLSILFSLFLTVHTHARSFVNLKNIFNGRNTSATADFSPTSCVSQKAVSDVEIESYLHWRFGDRQMVPVFPRSQNENEAQLVKMEDPALYLQFERLTFRDAVIQNAAKIKNGQSADPKILTEYHKEIKKIIKCSDVF